jgi:hypothetical protein
MTCTVGVVGVWLSDFGTFAPELQKTILPYEKMCFDFS